LSHREPSGFNLDVSVADGDLDAEVADALVFLSKHETELKRLRNSPSITGMCLDFGVCQRDAPAYFLRLPPELLSPAGQLGMEIELSLYAGSGGDAL
jgi:hypothetical protein